jgi:hypothetical protein
MNQGTDARDPRKHETTKEQTFKKKGAGGLRTALSIVLRVSLSGFRVSGFRVSFFELRDLFWLGL